MRSNVGSTPLNIAAYNGHTDVVKLLLEKGANIKAMSSDTRATPLYCASHRGHVGMVRLLLEKGTNAEATTSDNGRAALHGTALYRQTAIVQLLLEKGANIHGTANQAETALYSVFINPIINPNLMDRQQLIPTITVLLAYGENILLKDDSSKTPLDVAEDGGHFEARKLFLMKCNLKLLQEA